MIHPFLISAVAPIHGTTQALVQPGGLEVAADISTVALAAISALLLLAMLALMVQLRNLLAALQQQMQPVADRARVAAENVEYISTVVREDVQKVHSSVAGLSDRLKEASGRMEERVEEFNALMDVVQDEAESVLLDTAAAVRGVRAGARTIGESMAPPSPEDETGASTTGASTNDAGSTPAGTESPDADEPERVLVKGDAETE
jgi:hypothetical protein